MNNLAKIESLIFVAGDEGISLEQIVDATEFDLVATKNLIKELKVKYQEDESISIMLTENESIYRLITKPQFADVLSNYFQSSVNNKLSNAGLEVLTIIAYKQPVTRVEIDKIRGVNSSGSLSKLVAFDLIKEDGRKKEIGRPMLYSTTNFFLNYFNLNSLEDLPELPDVDDIINEQNEGQTELFVEKDNSDLSLENLQEATGYLEQTQTEKLSDLEPSDK